MTLTNNNPLSVSELQPATNNDWWRGAVIYQVYLRSFLDSNGDGIGDIRGCIERLDYIKGLGVDAIWLSPFFKSPMDDFGYDISDYRDVDPIFGTLEDLDELITKAHNLGLKIMIDQVLSHTSVAHAWFEESRQSRTNAKADWYVWADPKPDGSPPNNWLSIFGGVAWEWEPRRQQYYLHNFLKSQPDLNFHNRDVQNQILEEVEFWLKRGIDGLRLDAINFCFHDEPLRDNPAKPIDEREGRGFSSDNPYAYQYHYFNNTQPQNLDFLARLRSLTERYPGTTTLGEVSSEDSLQTMLEYTDGDKHLHMAYSFELLVDEFSSAHIRHTVESFVNRSQGGWPCWAISNHDVARVASRWGGDQLNSRERAQFSQMITALMASLQGSLCVYQGEELGLTEADVAFEDLQDPFGIAFWPKFKGRDGCRTPMPWDGSQHNAGFSDGAPWLPVEQNHNVLSVNTQKTLSCSTLEHFQQFMAWRKLWPALTSGEIDFIDSTENTLLFTRTIHADSNTAKQVILCAFNLSNTKVTLEQPYNHTITLNSPNQNADISADNNSICLPPFGRYFAQVNTLSLTSP